MQKERPRTAIRQSSSTNGKSTRDQRPDYHKTPDHFLRKLLDYPGAREALEHLESAGMSREVTVAFLRVIAFGPDDLLRRELPHPENLRAAAARIRRVADEIGTFNGNAHLNPHLLLKPYPRMEKAYAHMFTLLPGALSAYSGYLQLAAYLMGEIGKTKLSTSKLLVVNMLLHVKETTGREHFANIACLLTASAATRGSSVTTEPSALKMLLRRHRSSIARPRSLQCLPKGIREHIRFDKAFNSNRRPGFGGRIAGAAS